MRRQLERDRRRIATSVRSLRQERGWTQRQLADELELSQSRLSELERGDGSFSAEQFLQVLRLFNVPATAFTESDRDVVLEIQKSLARFGAGSLYAPPDQLPSDRLAELTAVLREALVEGSPRLVTGVAPVLLLHADTLNLNHLQRRLADDGFDRRLPWVVSNVLAAIELRYRGGKEATNLSPKTAPLQFFLDHVEATLRPSEGGAPSDILDHTIRSRQSLDDAREASSLLSRRWGIVTALQPEDFLLAMEPALETL